jgi:hypothetical protein
MHAKGWNRLVIVVCSAWCLFVLFAIIHEYLGINIYEQFVDRSPSRYDFWHWYPYIDASSYKLVPKIGYISMVMFLPPLIFGGVVYSTLWVFRGFRNE